MFVILTSLELSPYVPYPRNFVVKSENFHAENIKTWFYVHVTLLQYHVQK